MEKNLHSRTPGKSQGAFISLNLLVHKVLLYPKQFVALFACQKLSLGAEELRLWSAVARVM